MESLFNIINSNFEIDIVGCDSDDEGVEYLSNAFKQCIKIDLIILDVKNDEILNSRPLLLANQYKKTFNPNLSIVILSMADKTLLIQDAIDIGYIDYFLPKSISTEDLKSFLSSFMFLKQPLG